MNKRIGMSVCVGHDVGIYMPDRFGMFPTVTVIYVRVFTRLNMLAIFNEF